MRRSFIAAVVKELPNARIVIDHFHLIQDASKRLNEARKIEEDVEEKIKGNGPKRIPWKLLVRNKEDLKGEHDKLIMLPSSFSGSCYLLRLQRETEGYVQISNKRRGGSNT